MKIRLQDILSIIGQEYTLLGARDTTIDHIKPLPQADEESLVWTGTPPADLHKLVEKTPASIFILPLPAPGNAGEFSNSKSLIFVKDPRLAAITVLAHFFRQRPVWSKHPSAVIHPEASIAADTYIGPNTIIGKCTIESGTILYGNNYLYDNVKLGKNVTIHAGTVIGADGFGYQEGKEKEWLKFEHVGGVVIGSGVEIGANTCIDRGTLGDTIIGDGTKIDNLVHIAHNVQIGKHCLIIAHAMIGGSCVIGDHAWIAPNAGVLQKTVIGENATIGLGAVVLHAVPAGETWAGVPAHKIERK